MEILHPLATSHPKFHSLFSRILNFESWNKCWTQTFQTRYNPSIPNDCPTSWLAFCIWDGRSRHSCCPLIYRKPILDICSPCFTPLDDTNSMIHPDQDVQLLYLVFETYFLNIYQIIVELQWIHVQEPRLQLESVRTDAVVWASLRHLQNEHGGVWGRWKHL